MRSAASVGFSCSQTRWTVHPALSSRRLVSRSRRRFLLSFAAHHAAFARGNVRWIGQQCQKHPSTKTATFSLTNTMSARRREFGRIGRSTRNLSPCANRILRNAISAPVFRRRAERILCSASGDDAGGTAERFTLVGARHTVDRTKPEEPGCRARASAKEEPRFRSLEQLHPEESFRRNRTSRETFEVVLLRAE